MQTKRAALRALAAKSASLEKLNLAAASVSRAARVASAEAAAFQTAAYRATLAENKLKRVTVAVVGTVVYFGQKSGSRMYKNAKEGSGFDLEHLAATKASKERDRTEKEKLIDAAHAALLPKWMGKEHNGHWKITNAKQTIVLRRKSEDKLMFEWSFDGRHWFSLTSHTGQTSSGSKELNRGLRVKLLKLYESHVMSDFRRKPEDLIGDLLKIMETPEVKSSKYEEQKKRMQERNKILFDELEGGMRRESSGDVLRNLAEHQKDKHDVRKQEGDEKMLHRKKDSKYSKTAL